MRYISSNLLAIKGGKPVRKNLLPYGHQSIDDSDIKSVSSVLSSQWLTTGPVVDEFENNFSKFVNNSNAVAVSSGTAALHSSMYAADITNGDEVIVPAITFVATSNSVLYQQGVPKFVDVEPDSLLIDSGKIQDLITPKTKAIVAVDYAGQPCDYNSLNRIAEDNNLILIADACHSLGGMHKNKKVGSLANLNVFSFHPVKAITTGEGGMITTDNEGLAKKMRIFRNHGISSDHRERQKVGLWQYSMVDLGFNYRITDFQCALGISQLKKLPEWIKKRNYIAQSYLRGLSGIPEVVPLITNPSNLNAYHLFIVKLQLEKLKCDRDLFFKALRGEGIGVNVHYSPVYLHPYYKKRFNYTEGICPVAEKMSQRIISLPIYPAMTDDDVSDVIIAFQKAIDAFL